MKIPALRGNVIFAGTGNQGVRFTLTSNWIKIANTRPADPLPELILRYQRGYGPATVADFAYWTGLTVGYCKEGFKRVEDRVCKIDVPGSSKVYYDASSSVEEAAIPKVAILPKFDALVLGYRDKTRVLAEADRTRVFRPAAQVEALILIDGRIRATWRLKASTHDIHFSIEAFGRIPKATRNHVEDAFGPLAVFLQRDTYSVSYA